jgi:methyl-accepting chemotaxis protein
LAASAEELSRTTTAQSDEVTRTASAAEEMATSIREVARNADQAAQAATASSARAQAGGELAAETATGLDQADEIMKRLRVHSNEIGKIISLIQDVAAQTNILALNAAIEAAGAGAAGARFDVVAEEIRKLAGRTSQATGEIAELIGAVQADTQTAAEAISKGAAMAQESGASLADIVGSSASVNDMVQNISAATAEQSQASEEIARSIDAIVGGSQQIATATRETAQIGVELSNLAERLRDAADRFKA